MSFYKTKKINEFFLMIEKRETLLELKISGNRISEKSLNFLLLANKELKMIKRAVVLLKNALVSLILFWF